MYSQFFVRACLALAFVSQFFSSVQAELSYTPTATSEGVRYVLVSGQFANDDYLNEFDAIVSQHNPSFVVFDSPGGNLMKAMEFGRLIRRYRLNTVQPRGIECTSACSLAFLGGVMRFADPGAIGVHKSSFEDHILDTQTAVSAVQHVTAEVITYMIANGVDPALLQLALKYESDDIRYLSRSEMQQYGVVTGYAAGDEPTAADPPTAPDAHSPTVAALPSLPAPDVYPKDVPVARTGRVRHPRGVVMLKASPSRSATDIGAIQNGTRVTITHSGDRWYHLEIADLNLAGYMHDTWVAVDQFASGKSDQRHIQIASFNEFHSVQAFVRSSSIPVSVYVATTKWFAVTIDSAYDKDKAVDQLHSLKAEGIIPSDSFITYGNTYAIKLCCD